MGELVLRALLGTAAAVAGVLLARRSLKAATAVGAGLLALVLLKVVAGYIPAAEPNLFPWDFYPFIERAWWETPALMLIGIGLWACRGSVIKRDAILVAGGLILARVFILAALTGLELQPLLGRVGPGGLCRQTSSYSCSAAAAAMYLHRLGVEASEAEMAELCVTRRDGTTDSGIARGLRRKLPGRDVRVRAPRYDELRPPCLVSIRDGLAGHSLLMEDVDPTGVSLADPNRGRRRMSRADFEAAWQGSEIRAD